MSDILTPHEVMAIGLGLSRIIEDMEALNNDDTIPWTPDARKMKAEILNNAKSAAAKIEKATGFECRIDPYKDGDEDEFLTKES